MASAGLGVNDRMYCFAPDVLTFSVLLLSFTATAVRGVGGGRDPAGAAQVRRLRRGVRRLLPGPRPVLRLGREILLPLLRLAQEVSTHTDTLRYTHRTTTNTREVQSQIMARGFMKACRWLIISGGKQTHANC